MLLTVAISTTPKTVHFLFISFHLPLTISICVFVRLPFVAKRFLWGHELIWITGQKQQSSRRITHTKLHMQPHSILTHQIPFMLSWLSFIRSIKIFGISMQFIRSANELKMVHNEKYVEYYLKFQKKKMASKMPLIVGFIGRL